MSRTLLLLLQQKSLALAHRVLAGLRDLSMKRRREAWQTLRLIVVSHLPRNKDVNFIKNKPSAEGFCLCFVVML